MCVAKHRAVRGQHAADVERRQVDSSRGGEALVAGGPDSHLASRGRFILHLLSHCWKEKSLYEYVYTPPYS